eukprot:CAMPEP_0195515732 /NCGR_PEP_ID=MMETSP0794_2-20130614/6701_1 /TAXON_ID=515487 /ORGANISM="Stephanopyxis turris, Strain CCMP 815" /LENGTH=585 /DNA_ID=CAMNT_0040644205 /DNA_START=127 /DNA_END=1884 /DNA_ORIENTATION=+
MGSPTLYQSCSSGFSGGGDDLTRCISDNLQHGIDTFFLLYATALVFFMQAGFAMLCAGSVRQKNVQNSMLKNLLDACGAALGFWSVGYAFAYGGSTAGGPTTFIGNANFFLINMNEDFFLSPLVGADVFWLFQFAFAATSATIVAGTLAERCQMTAYLCYSVALTGFIYPVVVHAVWSPNGFLSPLNANKLWGSGMIDFSGSGVVHITGGVTALVATKILGSRRGRFYDSRGEKVANPKPIAGHSPSLQVLGTFILWFGWYGFNAGGVVIISNSTSGLIASHAALTTTLAAASACVSALVTNLIILERLTGEAMFDLSTALNGALSGLVSITAGCSVVEPWAAVVVGIVAGWIYLLTSKLLIKLRLDDAVDAIPVHFANGVWGVMEVGFFATPALLEQAYNDSTHVGWFYSLSRGSGDAVLLGVQAIGSLFIIGWVLVIMVPFFATLNYLGWFRADTLEEMVGLDISYHGGSALAGDVSSEYVEAMRLRKEFNSSRRRKNKLSQTNAESLVSENDNENAHPINEITLDEMQLHHNPPNQTEDASTNDEYNFPVLHNERNPPHGMDAFLANNQNCLGVTQIDHLEA